MSNTQTSTIEEVEKETEAVVVEIEEVEKEIEAVVVEVEEVQRTTEGDMDVEMITC